MSLTLLSFFSYLVFCTAEELSSWNRYADEWNKKLQPSKPVYDESKVCPGDWISWYDFFTARSPILSAYYNPIYKRTERNYSLCYQFKYLLELSTFEEAQQKCADNGGFLASIHSDDELALIQSYIQLAGIKLFKMPMAVWIGLTRVNRTDWEWNDGTMYKYRNAGSESNDSTANDSSLYTYNSPWIGETDLSSVNNTETAECMMLVPPTFLDGDKGAWLAADCNFRTGFVCKRDYFANSLTEEVNLTPGQPLGTGKTTDLCQWINTNECPSSNPMYRCINGPGTYQCQCAPGLQPALYKPFPDSAEHRVVDVQGYWNLHSASVCVDSDECENLGNGTSACGDDATCEHIRGGHTCRCNDEWLEWDGDKCAAINVCDRNPQLCDHTKCGPMSVPRCRNVVKGGYGCECITVPGSWIYVVAILLMIILIIAVLIEMFYLAWKWLNQTL